MRSTKLSMLSRKQELSKFPCVNLWDPEQRSHLWQGMNFPVPVEVTLHLTSSSPARSNELCICSPVSLLICPLCIYYSKDLQSASSIFFSEFTMIWGARFSDFSISTSDILSICILKISTCFTAMPPHPAARGTHNTVCLVDRELKKLNLPQNNWKKIVSTGTCLQRSKRNNGNKSWDAEASDLKSSGREDEQEWRKLALTPWGAPRTQSTGRVCCAVKKDQDKSTFRGISQDLVPPTAKCFPCKMLLELPEVSCQDVPIRGLITEIMRYMS